MCLQRVLICSPVGGTGTITLVFLCLEEGSGVSSMGTYLLSCGRTGTITLVFFSLEEGSGVSSTGTYLLSSIVGYRIVNGECIFLLKINRESV